MSIGNRDRKLLWGRSGNLCAKCRREVVAERTATDAESVVGDEAHIAAQSPEGPRYGQLAAGVGVDSYDNLILLCRIDHKIVDDQPGHYTVDVLLEMKAKHEQWVRSRLATANYPSMSEPLTEGLLVRALTTGAAVWDILEGSHASMFDSPDDSEVPAAVVERCDDFLQLCQDCVDIAPEVQLQGMKAIRDAKRELQRHISELADLGILAFGTNLRRTGPGYDPPLVFDVAAIFLRHIDDPGVEPASAG